MGHSVLARGMVHVTNRAASKGDDFRLPPEDSGGLASAAVPMCGDACCDISISLTRPDTVTLNASRYVVYKQYKLCAFPSATHLMCRLSSYGAAYRFLPGPLGRAKGFFSSD